MTQFRAHESGSLFRVASSQIGPTEIGCPYFPQPTRQTGKLKITTSGVSSGHTAVSLWESGNVQGTGAKGGTLVVVSCHESGASR